MNAKGKLITAIRTTGSAPTHTEVLNVLVRNLDLKAMESSVKVNTSKKKPQQNKGLFINSSLTVNSLPH